jgi:hypothetical protein
MTSLDTFATAAWALLLPLFFAQPAPAVQDAGASSTGASSALVLLELSDGQVLWGQILSHDAEHLDFLRADTGGRVRLPYKRLDQTQAQRLLETFGYVDHSGDELQVEADKLVLFDGSELVGRIVLRSEGKLWVKTAGATVPVPLANLRGGATPVRTSALAVFTRQELYQEEARKVDPQSAASLFAFGEFCERIRDFAHALESYQACSALDPGFKQAEVAARSARARVRAENQAQVDWLEKIDKLRARDRFADAATELTAFYEAHPKSPLAPDAAKLRSRVERERDAKLRRRTSESWHLWAAKLIESKARERELSLDAAIGSIEEQASEMIATAVHQQLVKEFGEDLTVDVVRRYWKERKNVRSRMASYGLGTWLLGEGPALKGLVKETQAQPAATSATDQQAREFAEKLARYLKSQEGARKNKSSQDESEDRDQFWQEFSSASRAQWLLAYYAENSGDMEVVGVRAASCSECGGTGAREVVDANAAPGASQNDRGSRGQAGASPGSTGGSRVVACRTCRGLGIVRRVVFR